MGRHSDPEKYWRAHHAYVKLGKTLAEIAVLLGVSVSTVQAWKRKARSQGEDWDARRRDYALATGGIGSDAEQLLIQFSIECRRQIEILREDRALDPETRIKLLASVAASYKKVIDATGRGDPKLSRRAIALDTLQDLADWISTHHPDQKSGLLDVLISFMREFEIRNS